MVAANVRHRNRSNKRKDQAVPTETTSIEDLPAPTSKDGPAPRVARRREQLAAATGILFVDLQVPILFLLGGARVIDDPPNKIRLVAGHPSPFDSGGCQVSGSWSPELFHPRMTTTIDISSAKWAPIIRRRMSEPRLIHELGNLEAHAVGLVTIDHELVVGGLSPSVRAVKHEVPAGMLAGCPDCIAQMVGPGGWSVDRRGVFVRR
jgi:hypothetical protein